ncbi:terminase small subunit [uncultured Salegentibacter sp.]|uniref:terminase small subunit n=1 Tax=uncultured Salegentibacter sp. TaxID=259320 RepID=UPI002592168B|nr:terminase small subunit [uncultured Salegentibacter sp.]
MPQLTPKQQKFISEYLVDLNATQAAIRAGYSESGARTEGARLLANANIQQKIQEEREKAAERNKISVDECVGILANLARFDIAEIYDSNGNLKSLDQIPKAHRMAIEGLDTDEINVDGRVVGNIRKARLAGRKGAIDMLLKYLGGYERDNNQQGGKITVFQIPDNRRG